MRVLWSFLLVISIVAGAWTQDANSSAQPQIPRLIRFSGSLALADKSVSSVGVTFAVYRDQFSGTPLWLETQNVAVDAHGNYSVLLGTASKDGIPSDLFLSNEAKWLGVKAEGQDEQARVLLVSVPYALKAGDAETLGGKPASSFVLAPPIADPSAAVAAAGDANFKNSRLAAGAVSSLANAGTANFIGKFSNATDLVSSTIYEDPNTFRIGIGTTTPSPLARLEVNGGIVLRGQVTHQIQMIGQASSGRLGQDLFGFFFASDTPGQSIRMYTTPTGGTLTSRLAILHNGQVGIGTSTPIEKLEVNGNLLLRGQNYHQIQLLTPTSGTRIGQDTNGLFIAEDNPDKIIRFLSSTGNGPLTQQMVITGTGNVGIGTTSPLNKLSVAGVVESTSGGFKFPDGSTLTSAIAQGTSSFTGNNVSQIVNVVQSGTGAAANFSASNASRSVYSVQNGAGIGTLSSSGIPAAFRGDSTTTSGNAAGVLGTSSSYSGYGVVGMNFASCPDPPLDPNVCNSVGTYGWSVGANHGTGVWGQAESTSGDNVGVYGQALGNTGTGVFGYSPTTAPDSDGVGVYGATEAPKGTGVFGQANSTTGATAGLYGVVFSTSGVGAQLDVPTGGNIVIGRSGTSPTYNKVFRVDATGKGFFNGGTQASGADFAESVDVMGGASKYQPGDVLMVDESGTRRFARANEAYSTKIAGIYSTKPGVLATTHQDGDPRLDNEVPLAIVGIVPCKVSAENGPIKAGDLLVSSSKAGYAMKGTDRKKMFGAVVGKALGSLDKGTGVIEVLVSLH